MLSFLLLRMPSLVLLSSTVTATVMRAESREPAVPVLCHLRLHSWWSVFVLLAELIEQQFFKTGHLLSLLLMEPGEEKSSRCLTEKEGSAERLWAGAGGTAEAALFAVAAEAGLRRGELLGAPQSQRARWLLRRR